MPATASSHRYRSGGGAVVGGSAPGQARALVVASLTVLFFVIAIVRSSRSSLSSSLSQPPLHFEDQVHIRLEPVMEVVEGMQAAWQLPGRGGDHRPKGVFILFHGCGRHNTDWYTYPEERRIVTFLLSQDYAVMALQQTTSDCWSTALRGNRDLALAKAATLELLSKNGLIGLPIFAMGASSGGSFTMVYPTAIPVAGAVVQISPGEPGAVPVWLADEERETAPAPVVFLYMAGDTRWASEQNIAMTKSALEDKGHPVLVLRADGPDLHESFFSERMEGQVTPKESALLFTAMVGAGFVTCGSADQVKSKRACELASDPRRDHPLQRLSGDKAVDPVVKVVIDRYRDYLEELLNVAYNQHEITSEKLEQWFEYVTKPPSVD